MKEYVVFDLETPNHFNNSISSVALLVVKDNKITENINQLIDPESHFDNFNIDLTGISPDDVKDCPRFNEYWPQIKDYLTSNVIVGHNIKFDLCVLSKVLDGYKLDIPEFDYCCTLRHSRKNFRLNSYRLIDVSRHINFNYKPHIASEDVLASYNIFEYINKKNKITSDDCGHYHYRLHFRDLYDENLTVNLNNLYGILYILQYYSTINSHHFQLLKQWYYENECYTDTTIFNNINKQLKYIMDKDKINSRDINFLLRRTPPITTSDNYSDEILFLQILQGLISVIMVDFPDLDKLNILYDYMMNLSSLKGSTIYDDIVEIIKESLNNENITKENENKLFKLFNEVLDMDLSD